MTDNPGSEGEADTTVPAVPARSPEAASSFQGHMRAARSELEHHVERARADFEHVNERINQRTGRNLLVAILIGVGIGAVVLGSLIFVKWIFVLVAIPICLLGVFEFARAQQTAGRRVDLWPQLVAGAIIMAAGFYVGHWTHWVITIASVALPIVWRVIAQMLSSDGRRYGDVVSDVLVAGFLPLYVPFLASLTLVLVRQDQGEYWLLAMIVAVVAADTGAYASGLAFGKHPMAPRVSPKKTWEGFAWAAVAATLGATLFSVFVLRVPIWVGLVIGVAVLVTATLGDLGESMIKRDLGIKDMSSWLPGHGGVLDRLDSVLPSAAVILAAYFLFSPLAGS